MSDRAGRMLAFAASGLPRNRAVWGAAMRAELAAIDEPGARRRFARSATRAALAYGYGIRIGLPLLAGVIVAAISVVASRVMLADTGTGLLSVTVPIPALVLLLVALAAGAFGSSARVGLEAGLVALAACAVATFAVLALEGQVWMSLRGVFILDGDPPRMPVGASGIALNVFTTGMWVGHLVVWVPALLIGAALGGWIGRVASADARAVRHG
jgi:hypothetical protein